MHVVEQVVIRERSLSDCTWIGISDHSNHCGNNLVMHVLYRQIEIPTIRQIHVPQPRIGGHIYITGVVQNTVSSRRPTEYYRHSAGVGDQAIRNSEQLLPRMLHPL